MQLLTIQIDAPSAYVLPVGDLHFGDRAFKKHGLPRLKGMMDWALEHKSNTIVPLLGDIFNVAGRGTKTSPFESDPNEYKEAVEFFRPYKEVIACAVPGNHEWRMMDMFGFEPLQMMCRELGVPYLGISGILKVQVGKRPENNWYWNTYHIAIHHSRGGGGKIGNSINNATKLLDVYEGCDVYLIGHNHQLAAASRSVYYPSQNSIKERKVYFVSCGSYLAYPDSYAENAMMAPAKVGSPRIRLSGERDRHDVHVSI